MKSLVQRVLSTHAEIAIEEIDISNDDVLSDRYGLEIPVLMIDGKKVAKYRISEDELRTAVGARTAKKF